MTNGARLVESVWRSLGRFPSVSDVEREHIRLALIETDGHKGLMCKLLDMTRPTLRRKIRRYGLGKEIARGKKA